MGKIDHYFMTRDAPNGAIRRFDLKKVRMALIGLGALALVVVLALPNGQETAATAAISIANNTTVSRAAATDHSASARNGDFYLSNLSGGAPSNRSGSYGRQFSASQLVKSESGGFEVGLASGTSLPAKILNRVVTSEPRSPVVAVITSSSADSGGVEIPAGTKVLGTADANSGSERVQVLFHTMVFENGREIALNALAVMPDGSNGIAGDYHSQMLRKEGGRFLSHFTAGFANSYKDREGGGVFPLEPGNLKNAALGGISESASEQAKAYADELKNVRPFVSVEPGTTFLIFLDKGLKL